MASHGKCISYLSVINKINRNHLRVNEATLWSTSCGALQFCFKASRPLPLTNNHVSNVCGLCGKPAVFEPTPIKFMTIIFEQINWNN